MNKPVYLGFSILDLSNTVTYEFGENTKLCHMDTDSFIVHVKIENIYKDIHYRDFQILS